MKLKFLLLVLILVMLAPAAQAQLDVYGAVGAGWFKQDGDTKVGMFGGGDLKIMFDTANGISMFTRTMVLYSEFDDDFQGAAEFFMTQKRLGILRDLYIAFGPGYYYRFRDGADEQNVALRFVMGTDILGGLGIDVGADYIPSIPTEDPSQPATTRWFFHGAVNLYPRL